MPNRRDRPPRHCPKCEQPILWWRNANRKGMVCVDLSSDDAGTVRKLVNDDPDHPGQTIVWGKKLSGMDLAAAKADGVLLFTLHSVTCPAERPPNPRPAGLEIPTPTRSHR